METKHTETPDGPDRRRRLPYEKPELQELGNVLELTKGGTSGEADGFGGRRRP